MAFILGNFNIDEILYGVAQSTADDEILYTLDQLSSATINVTAESTDITDKKGNVVHTVYTSKAGELQSTNAFLHPQIMNAASGSEIEKATTSAPIVMPFIKVYEASTATTPTVVDISNAVAGTIQVVGLYANGANEKALTPSEITAATSGTDLTLPQAGADKPVQYLVKYDRSAEDGIKLVNDAKTFPETVALTLFCSYVDVCSDTLKPCYVVIPKFLPDPAVSISLDRTNQQMDFNGKMNIDYCEGTKALYYIYFPAEDLDA